MVLSLWRFLTKVKIELLYDPVNPLLGMYLEKIMIQKEACTPVFTAVLFTIAETRKQAKHPSTEEWTTVWYIYIMEYYSAIKKNAIMQL